MKKSSRPSTAEARWAGAHRAETHRVETRGVENRGAGTHRVVLGIDPGTLVTVYGIVSRRGNVLQAVASGIIRNAPETGLADRLLAIHGELTRLIRTHRPEAISVESAFTGKNAQSALKLGHARGVALLAAAQSGIPPVAIAPREAKLAVTGRGNATKEQVRYMVASLLGITPRSLPLDASDALAVALTLLLRQSQPRPRPSDWGEFIKAHPERVRA